MTNGLAFHHIGVACRDLDAETAVFAALGYRPERDDFVDPVQQIQGRFLTGSGPRLELVAALPRARVLEPWLQHGVKFYHQAFEADAMRTRLDELLGHGGKLLVAPLPAVAFEGREIAFIILRNLALIELIASTGGAGQ